MTRFSGFAKRKKCPKVCDKSRAAQNLLKTKAFESADVELSKFLGWVFGISESVNFLAVQSEENQAN